MKMVKKILLGTLAFATVLAFTSCNGIANDNAEKEGDKKKMTITVDGTGLADDEFKRAFEQQGTLEQLQEVTVTLSCKKEDVKAGSVIGFAFDLNYEKDENGKDIKDLYNFYLVGFRPSTGKYYIERYKEVSMSANNGALKTKSLGKYISYDPANAKTTDKWQTVYADSYNDWQSATSGKEYAVDTDGNLTMKIAVKQTTDGVYTVKLGNGTEIACPADARTVNKKDSKLQGGIAVYANATKDAKFSVTSTVDEDSVVGKWEAEEL